MTDSTYVSHWTMPCNACFSADRGHHAIVRPEAAYGPITAFGRWLDSLVHCKSFMRFRD